MLQKIESVQVKTDQILDIARYDQFLLRILVILIPLCIAIFQIIFIMLSRQLNHDFGWKIYKKIVIQINSELMN